MDTKEIQQILDRLTSLEVGIKGQLQNISNQLEATKALTANNIKHLGNKTVELKAEIDKNYNELVSLRKIVIKLENKQTTNTTRLSILFAVFMAVALGLTTAFFKGVFNI